MIRRVDLSSVWQGQAMPPDTAEACTKAAGALHALGLRLEHASEPRKRSDLSWEAVRARPGPISHLRDPSLSALPTGREVHLRVSGQGAEEARVLALWSSLIPLGFVPWDRFPLVSSPTVGVFHHFGPWKFLMDHHMATGRGEHAWSSFCAAAQSDIGMWEGRERMERFIQAQLYRLGLGHGPVDGILGSLTRKAIKDAGMPSPPGCSLSVLAERLAKAQATTPSGGIEGGQVLFEGKMTVQAWGGVEVRQVPRKGASFTVGGPGRVVLDFES